MSSSSSNTEFTIEDFKSNHPFTQERKSVLLRDASVQDMIAYAVDVVGKLESVGQRNATQLIISICVDLLHAVGDTDISNKSKQTDSNDKGSKYDDRVMFAKSGKFDVQVYLHILVGAIFTRLKYFRTSLVLSGKQDVARSLDEFLAKYGQQNESGRGLKIVDTIYRLAPPSSYEKIKYFFLFFHRL